MIPSIRSQHLRSFVQGFVLALALAMNLGLSSSANAQANTLFMNDYLFRGQQLVYGCRYRLVMQQDGNLVLYDHNGVAYWASNTVGTGRWAVMQPDGNFVIYDAGTTTPIPVWASGTWQWGSSSLRLQSDRNAVIYDATLTPRWATNTWTGTLPSVPSCNWRGTKTNLWPGYNIPGGDYSVSTFGSEGTYQSVLCAFSCYLDSRCVAFSYVDSTRQCWLKNTSSNLVQTSGVSSGFVTR